MTQTPNTDPTSPDPLSPVPPVSSEGAAHVGIPTDEVAKGK
jgi:hypothetical protein